MKYMITIFNRKELMITRDMDRYANAKDDLKAAGIDFTLGSKGNNFKHATARARTGMPNGTVSYDSGMVYIIYVHEKDYNRAVAAIHRNK